MAAVEPSAVGLIGSAVAIVAAITGWITAKATASKGRADTDGVIVASAERVVALMDGRLKAMQDEAVRAEARCAEQITSLRAEVARAERHIATLESALTDAGIPVPPLTRLTKEP